jgi:hypothetical protein
MKSHRRQGAITSKTPSYQEGTIGALGNTETEDAQMVEINGGRR